MSVTSRLVKRLKVEASAIKSSSFRISAGKQTKMKRNRFFAHCATITELPPSFTEAVTVSRSSTPSCRSRNAGARYREVNFVAHGATGNSAHLPPRARRPANRRPTIPARLILQYHRSTLRHA